MTDYKLHTDTDLLDLLKSDDRFAYTEIYNRYILVLLNHAYNKTRNREEAKDIVQEVFAMLWSKRSNLSISTNLAGLLYTSVRNIFLNQVAHKNVQSKYFSSVLQFSNQTQNYTDHLVREKQLTALIEKEIAALPDKMREVFELSRKSHMSHKEIAAYLDISDQTVSKHITNALKILHGKLGILLYLAFISQIK